MKTKLIILSIAALCLSTAPALGDLVNSGRQWGSATSLNELQTQVFDAIGSTVQAYGDQSPYGYFEPASKTASTTYVATISWFYPGLEFGIYELGDTSNKLKLFDLNSVVGDSVSIEFDQGADHVKVYNTGGTLATSTYFKHFGFYAIGEDHQGADIGPYYSEDTLNPYDDAHFLTYESKGDDVTIANVGTYNDYAHWYVAAETDIATNRTANADFTDFVVQVESILPVPVPGAVLLGILGLSAAGIKLRRFA